MTSNGGNPTNPMLLNPGGINKDTRVQMADLTLADFECIPYCLDVIGDMTIVIPSNHVEIPGRMETIRRLREKLLIGLSTNPDLKAAIGR